jgi:Fe(3+) dicitrate transport protein
MSAPDAFLLAFMIRTVLLLPALCAAVAASPLAAQRGTAPDSARRPDSVRRTAAAPRTTTARRQFRMPEVRVIGTAQRDIERLPGAATLITSAQLDAVRPINTNEMLRRVPGVATVDDEGFGLRLNVGFRGADPSRGRTVVLLEDGVPITLGPYGEPDTYYSPTIERMNGVEVVKGAASILFGPQTTTGVINFLTATPPDRVTPTLRVRGGGNGFLDVVAGIGGPIGTLGAGQLTVLNKQVNDLNGVAIRVDDITGKFSSTIGTTQRLGIKAGVYRERSNMAYLGLTDRMWARREIVPLAPDDAMVVERPSASVTHEWSVAPTAKLTTTAFAYQTTRNNRRQDFTRNTASNTRPSGFTGVIWGDTLVRGGAVFMRRTSGARNRRYTVSGLESTLSGSARWFGVQHDMVSGGRVLQERATERFIIGRSPTTSDSVLRDLEYRTGVGAAAYVQDRITLIDGTAVTLGLRVESYRFQRDIRRLSFPSIGIRDTALRTRDATTALIPGAGITQQLGRMELYGGVHRGFAPMRVKDAIDNSGLVTTLEPERSWNYEAGVRGAPVQGVRAEATVFLLDFDNQVIPVSDTWGRQDELAAGVANAGRTRNRGVELSLAADLGVPTNGGWPITAGARYTYTDARFTSDRFVQGSSGPVNVNGNRLPYAPAHMLSADVGVRLGARAELQAFVTRVGSQFGDRRNLGIGTADGQNGQIPGYTVLDLNATWRLPAMRGSAPALLLSVKNLADTQAIISRRPQGIKTLIPRQVLLGLDLQPR